jgi:hypothetical protein
VLESLSAGAYYWPFDLVDQRALRGTLSESLDFARGDSNGWQVRTAGGAVLADNGAWHAFTVSMAALYTKQAPGNGATGLGSTVTLQWTAVPEEGYAVCWDASDNGACDSAWWPNGAATARVVEALSAGIYYWPFDFGESWALRATLSERQ